jgi:iron complex transport system substrate-binding protein
MSGGAEDLLVVRPDVVVASLFDKRATREILKDKGLQVAEFGVPRSLADVKDQIHRMGEITQHPDRADAEIARLDAAVARARQEVVHKRIRVLPLSRRGWVSGSESLLSSLLTAAGLSNAAGDLGVAFGGFAPLETIVAIRPDFLVVSGADEHAEDDGSAFLLHPALQRFYPSSRRIVIPDRLTVCGGVMLAEALDLLVAELRRVEPSASLHLSPAGRGEGRYPVSTGPPAFFHASMPPSIWAVFSSPASLAAFTAIAERSPNAQKNTIRRPVPAATSRSMPPGRRLSSIPG